MKGSEPENKGYGERLRTGMCPLIHSLTHSFIHSLVCISTFCVLSRERGQARRGGHTAGLAPCPWGSEWGKQDARPGRGRAPVQHETGRWLHFVHLGLERGDMGCPGYLDFPVVDIPMAFEFGNISSEHF